jgi:hypothetical protein
MQKIRAGRTSLKWFIWVFQLSHNLLREMICRLTSIIIVNLSSAPQKIGIGRLRGFVMRDLVLLSNILIYT